MSNLNAYKNYLGSVDNFGKKFEKIMIDFWSVVKLVFYVGSLKA